MEGKKIENNILNNTVIEEYVRNNQFEKLANYINLILKIKQDPLTGVPLKFDYSFENLNILIKLFKGLVYFKNLSEPEKFLLIEILRALRNCTTNKNTQDHLINDKEFLKYLSNFLNEIYQDNQLNYIKVTNQLLVNITVDNNETTQIVYDLMFDFFIKSLDLNGCLYESAALLYNISIYRTLNDLNSNFFEKILHLYIRNNNVEYLHFLIEKFITYSNFWNNTFNNLPLNHRIIVLEIIKEIQFKGYTENLSESAIDILTNKFSNSNSIIFQTLNVINSTEMLNQPYEVILLIEILASISCNENYLKILQLNKDFLINVGIVLINLNRLGKKLKLSDLNDVNVNIRNSPDFGMKANLIRILGNLCWKNETTQNLIREAELIPVILDCCNMDEKNPYIMQWSIYTIRNLCENNLENQKIINSLQQQDVVNSDILNEMGLTLYNDSHNNTIKLISLENIKK